MTCSRAAQSHIGAAAQAGRSPWAKASVDAQATAYEHL